MRDTNGAAIAIFTAGKHIPSETSHQTTLQGVVYQLDVALEDLETQRSGIVFIYNMTGSKYSNFDYELSQKMLGLLKGAYPARLKKVLIVTAPLWFKATFKILRLFVREKLRDRVFMINISQLPNHIPISSLPTDLGGQFAINHNAWLMKCLNSSGNKINELCDLASSKSLSLNSNSVNSNQNGAILSLGFVNNANLQQTNGGLSDEDESASISDKLPNLLDKELNSVNNSVTNSNPVRVECIQTNNTNNSSDNDLDDDLQGVTLEEFIQHLKTKGRKGLYEEYREIKSSVATGTFEAARLRENQSKNRYTDVLCYDHTRVKLSVIDGDPSSDYINANFVDGYKQKNAFISTQGN